MEYISSAKNSKIQDFIKLVIDKKHRKKTNLFVCEGELLLTQALDLGTKINTLIMSDSFKSEFRKRYEKIDATIIEVPHYLMEKISDTKTPQGVVFSCDMMNHFGNDYSSVDFGKMKKIIILDELKDPGNMGTIIRTGAGLDIDAIILINNCVDHYSPKVVRSTMGGIFNIRVIPMTIDECFEKIKLPIYATYLSDESKNITDVSMKECAVIIGNESKGVSDQVLQHTTEKVIIPINSSNIESLNASVAASIVMWEMSKK